jgi:hypothetical protein
MCLQYGPVEEDVHAAANLLADVFECEPPHDHAEGQFDDAAESGSSNAAGNGGTVFNFGPASSSAHADAVATEEHHVGRGREMVVPAWMTAT